jgi:serpin B
MLSRSSLSFVPLILGLTACDKPPPSQSVRSEAPSAALASVAAASSAAPPSPAPTEPHAVSPGTPEEIVRRGSNAFGIDLLGRLATREGNSAFSPASLSIAFAMTWAGARGQTAAEIAKVLHFETPEVVGTWGRLARSFNYNARPFKLHIANRLFGESSYSFEPAFLEQIRTSFGAPLEQLDFKRSYEPSRARINGWVAQQTAKRTYAAWLQIVRVQGPQGLRAIKGFHDEALQGTRKGQRSSRLNRKWRVIYSVKADVVTVEVEDVNAHDYR